MAVLPTMAKKGHPSNPPQTPPSAGQVPQPNDAYPIGPEDSVTPGALCANPTEYRYPEKIKYCARNVESSEKELIIRDYDQRFGFKIRTMPRSDFKIDHLIPLCAGGANDNTNLWPQYKTVYVKTDRIEESVCILMGKGQMKQAEAVTLVLDVKHHLEKADAVLADLLRQIGN